jgi:hypothetical protein
VDSVDAVQLGGAKMKMDAQTSGSLQEFIELITAEIRKMSEAQKAEFRAPWLAYIAEKENDRRFLRSAGVDPDGD